MGRGWSTAINVKCPWPCDQTELCLESSSFMHGFTPLQAKWLQSQPSPRAWTHQPSTAPSTFSQCAEKLQLRPILISNENNVLVLPGRTGYGERASRLPKILVWEAVFLQAEHKLSRECFLGKCAA